MKKLFLLLIAVCVTSGLMADGHGNQWGDASVKQIGNDNKAHIDQTEATGGGWYYNAGSGTDATIFVKGDRNQTTILQAGYKNVAGWDIKNVSVDYCEGFDANLEGKKFGRKISMTMAPITLACMGTLPKATYTAKMKVRPGIYIKSCPGKSSDDNVGSISQDGDYNLAGIEIHGKMNVAGIKQGVGWAEYNVAGIDVKGRDNKVMIKQYYDNNTAMTEVHGHANTVGLRQSSADKRKGNKAFQEVHGNGNQVFAIQDGVKNKAIQKVHGRSNSVLLLQEGNRNMSVQITTGKDHNSWVEQIGNRNQSTVLQ